MLPPLRVSLAAGLACVICFVAGYLLAGWWSDAHDTTPLEQICDHVNSLEEEFPEQQDEEVRHQFKALVEQCRSALDRVLTLPSAPIKATTRGTVVKFAVLHNSPA